MSSRTPLIKRLLKRWARHLVVASSGLTRNGANYRLTPGLRILTYHRIADDLTDPFAVSPADFCDQMKLLSLTQSVQPLEQALMALRSEEVTRPQIALTFDDGTSDFLRTALPVLSRLQLPATLFVSPARVGHEGFLGWDELQEVRNAGVRIGSHGLDHRSFGSLNREDLWNQIMESRTRLEDRLGICVTSLAYPYGTVRDFSDESMSLVRKAGYSCACSSINGVNLNTTDPMGLKRTKIEQGDGPVFGRIVAGGIDNWAFVDRYLSVLQGRYEGK